MVTLSPYILLIVSLLLVVACGKPDIPTAADHLANQSANPEASDPVTAALRAQSHAEEMLALNSVSAVVKIFFTTENRYPISLNELIEKGYISSFPPLPASKKLSYNPKDGRVEVVRADPPTDAPSPPTETPSNTDSTPPSASDTPETAPTAPVVQPIAPKLPAPTPAESE